MYIHIYIYIYILVARKYCWLYYNVPVVHIDCTDIDNLSPEMVSSHAIDSCCLPWRIIPVRDQFGTSRACYPDSRGLILKIESVTGLVEHGWTFTGYPYIYIYISLGLFPWFPVDFPFNQSSDSNNPSLGFGFQLPRSRTLRTRELATASSVGSRHFDCCRVPAKFRWWMVVSCWHPQVLGEENNGS